MSNNTNSNQPLPKRKEIVADFKRIYHDSLKEEYSEEYRSLAEQMYRFAQKVASAPITSKNKETISTIKNNQRDFLLNMKSLLDTIRTDTGKRWKTSWSGSISNRSSGGCTGRPSPTVLPTSPPIMKRTKPTRQLCARWETFIPEWKKAIGHASIRIIRESSRNPLMMS